jgi:hypothetical protein
VATHCTSEGECPCPDAGTAATPDAGTTSAPDAAIAASPDASAPGTEPGSPSTAGERAAERDAGSTDAPAQEASGASSGCSCHLARAPARGRGATLLFCAWLVVAMRPRRQRVTHGPASSSLPASASDTMGGGFHGS